MKTLKILRLLINALILKIALLQAQGQVNDNFENAAPLASANANALGTNSAATLQLGEPETHGRASLWWRWTAPANGIVTIDTTESTFDTVLAAYVGDSLDQLIPVAANNNTPTANTSRIMFQTAQNQTYRIAVGVNGHPFGSGHVTHLHLNFDPQSSARSVVGRPTFNDRLALTGTNAFGVGYTIRGTLWWTWIAPTNGIVTIDNRGSEAYTAVSVYAGNSVDQLLPVRSALSNADGSSSSQVAFQAAAGSTYQISLSVPTWVASQGNVLLNLNMQPNAGGPTVVGTDNFNSPHALTGFLAHGIANSLGSGREPGEPAFIGDGSTIWWSWTAPADGQVVIDTLNSDFDTILHVLTGQFVTDLLRVTNNDNYNGLRVSRVVFNAQAHRRYHIAVAGNPAFSPRVGNIDLHLYQAGGPDDRLHIYAATEVELFALSGRRYQLQKSPDLTNWQNVGGAFDGSNAFAKWFFPARPGEKEFYRANPVPQ